jgi:hypothetical protein
VVESESVMLCVIEEWRQLDHPREKTTSKGRVAKFLNDHWSFNGIFYYYYFLYVLLLCGLNLGRVLVWTSVCGLILGRV